MNARTLKKHLKYMVPQMRLVLVKEPGARVAINGPEDLSKFVEPLKHYSEEHFVAFHLDAKINLVGYHIVSHGTVSSSLVHPREVFKAALLANSSSIIVAHNHPTGSLEPSREDFEVTEILIKAGDLLGVKVLDHIIVSSSGTRSLREDYGHLWAPSGAVK
jgi:DNA repair protein RadC